MEILGPVHGWILQVGCHLRVGSNKAIRTFHPEAQMTAARLDRINLRILEELQQNARITNQELAEKVALSPSACLARVRKLEAEGILPRFMARVALEKVERILEAFIEVSLEHHSRSGMTRFLDAVKAHPHMVSCHRVSGHF